MGGMVRGWIADRQTGRTKCMGLTKLAIRIAAQAFSNTMQHELGTYPPGQGRAKGSSHNEHDTRQVQNQLHYMTLSDFDSHGPGDIAKFEDGYNPSRTLLQTKPSSARCTSSVRHQQTTSSCDHVLIQQARIHINPPGRASQSYLLIYLVRKYPFYISFDTHTRQQTANSIHHSHRLAKSNDPAAERPVATPVK